MISISTKGIKMPHTDARLNYTVTFTDREFRIVTMALADLLEDQDDIDEALKLNTTLCHQRLVMVNQAREVAEAALEKASELENPNVPPKTH